jgi:hypothetical protein
VDEVAEEVDVIGMVEDIVVDVGVEADMTITVDAVEEADMVVEEEDMVEVGTVADVTIMVVAVAEVEEDMAVSRIYLCYCYSTSSITDDL